MKKLEKLLKGSIPGLLHWLVVFPSKPHNCCTPCLLFLCLHLSVSHSPLALLFLRSHMLWIRAAVHREPWILSEKFSFLISAASFTLNLLPRAKRQHGIYKTCARCRKCDYRLSISLSILFSPYPRQRGNGEDVLTPQTGVLLLSLIFLTPVFTSPSISYIPFFPFTCLASSYRPFCRHFSVCLSLRSLFCSLVLRGNSPAPLRSLFHCRFLSLWLSLTCIWVSYWYSQIQPAYRLNMIRFQWVNGRE